MTTLYIIGNGFDLYHGLPTSYTDFYEFGKKLLDEIEDVFNNDDNPFRKRQKNKAWINRILENNVIPTMWITNDVYSIDNAVIRRFDMSIEVPIPTKSKRIEIINKFK